MTILIVFFLTWGVSALWARSRKMSATIAWGGGFITALVMTLIVSGGYSLAERYRTYQAAQIENQQDGALNKARILAGMGEFAPVLEPAPAAEGRSRALGKTQGGSTGILEITGQSIDVEVEKATLAIPARLNDEQVQARNLQMATRYIHTLFPEWVSPETWLESNALASTETKVVEREGRRITAKHSKELSLWFLTVEKI
ncbi:hypothetical protein [Pseudomonas sp.]|uniref:hypothetical protein n=1 Tax=Pseudomonas sp. TaxID=306 RepID=UPI00260E7946|nr:hypothetical protein [Pseudomonas sp.]